MSQLTGPKHFHRDRDNVWVECTLCTNFVEYTEKECSSTSDTVCKPVTECDSRCTTSPFSPLKQINCMGLSWVIFGFPPFRCTNERD